MASEPPTPTAFSDLPKELRLTIWELALMPEPPRIKEFGVPTRRPKALRINSEAREVALKHYCLVPTNVIGGLWSFKYVSFIDDFFRHQLEHRPAK